MKKNFFLVFILFVSFAAKAQDKPAVTVYGFVKNDAIYDSRQVKAVREGHFLFHPLPESLDANKADVNAVPSFHMLSIQSRLGVKAAGPDAFGAKTSGVIEMDFFATTDATINLLRLRHAYGKLTWEKSELTFGQFWNPLFITECFPDVISFNTGSPFQPFARNPQIRYAYNVGKLKFTAVAHSQVDYASNGPLGRNSSYIRNSGLPELNIQLQYKSKDEATGNELVAGAGAGYKTLMPYTTNPVSKLKTDEKVSSLHAIGYLKLKTKPVTVRLEGVYGGNLSDVLSIGGFAAIYDTIATKQTGNWKYTDVKSASFWLDANTNGETVQFGIFAGYTMKLGASDAIDQTTYQYSFIDPNVASIYRVAPRIVYSSGKVKFAFEFEMTTASFGDKTISNSIDAKGKISETTSVTNYRGLLGIYYNF